LTDGNLVPLFKILDLWGAPLYLHVTLNPVANLQTVVGLARAYPNMNFVVGHMGFATSDVAAIVACQTSSNLFLESSIGSVLAFKEVRRREVSAKLVFGSEFPTHDPGIEFKKLGLVFDGDAMQRIAFKNAESLLTWKAAAG
jgi:predicted TIM-barrel fold metal-dependent hydrolase